MPALPPAIVKIGYRAQAIDTSIDTDVLMFALLRRLTAVQKAARVQALDRSIRQLSPIKNMIEDPISLAIRIAQILDRCDIPYYIGGSLASSLWGEPRYSEDLDLIIFLLPERVTDLINALMPQFYLSEVAVQEAVTGKCSSFNIISLVSTEKVDLFVSQFDGFSLSKLDRRVSYLLPTGDAVWVSSPEDIILQKLVWGQGDRSEKQWRDVLGVLKVQQANLDINYLNQWAEQLGVTEYLDRAFIQAGF
jgi:hypothetical protein